MIPFVWNVQNEQMYWDRKPVSTARGQEVEGEKGVTANEHGVSFSDKENVKLLVEMVVQFYQYTKNYSIRLFNEWAIGPQSYWKC